jgi:hypothetical protein
VFPKIRKAQTTAKANFCFLIAAFSFAISFRGAGLCRASTNGKFFQSEGLFRQKISQHNRAKHKKSVFAHVRSKKKNRFVFSKKTDRRKKTQPHTQATAKTQQKQKAIDNATA